jgi:hypothetical protein
MKNNLFKILLMVFAAIFLFQAISGVVIIPVALVISFLGQSENPSRLFFSGITAIFSILVSFTVIEFLYSFGFKRESGLVSKQRVMIQGIVAFITVWLTFFTYGILSILNVIPKTIESLRLVNIYLFWFLLINVLIRFIGSYKNKDNAKPDQDVLDKKRITWFSYITGFNKIDEFVGEKGEIVYSQTKVSNIICIIVMVVAIPSIKSIFIVLGNFIFYPIPINNLSEFEFLVRFISGLAFLAIFLATIYILGIALSRGLVLYKNAIRLPLATLSDSPLFTFLLPKSTIVLSLGDIISYSFVKGKVKRSGKYYLDFA